MVSCSISNRNILLTIFLQKTKKKPNAVSIALSSILSRSPSLIHPDGRIGKSKANHRHLNWFVAGLLHACKGTQPSTITTKLFFNWRSFD